MDLLLKLPNFKTLFTKTNMITLKIKNTIKNTKVL